jgi:type 1 fimbriae regulatory protein FimB/type 1 fimbriae regulatory protein FimE
MEKLMKAATDGRYGHRDRTLFLVMYRRGLRVSETIALRWEQFDLKAGLFSVQRLKRGVPSTHPLRGPELRALRELRREWPDSSYLFVSEHGGPMTASNVRKLVTRTLLAAKLPLPAALAVRINFLTLALNGIGKAIEVSQLPPDEYEFGFNYTKTPTK